MFRSLEELAGFLANAVLQDDKSIVGRLPAYVDGYFASLRFDTNRCIIEGHALATAFGDKVPIRSELSERVFHLLEWYSFPDEGSMATIVKRYDEQNSSV